MKIKGLDETDNRIVGLLMQDARTTYSEIGEKIGLSRVAVRNRISAMEAKGVLRGYTAEVDPGAISTPTVFYVSVETRTEFFEETSARLREEPEVVYLFHTSGSNGLMAICSSYSKDARGDFASRIRNNYAGLTYFQIKDIWSVEKGILPIN